MRFFNPRSVALFGSLALLLAPNGAYAQSPSTVSSPTLALTHVVGSEAVSLAGTAQPNQRLEVALYARFSRDLPTVLLSRRQIAADAAGHYAVTMSTASAFFRDAIVIAVVRAPQTDASAQASLLVTAPNVPAPPDDTPPSMR
jgi:hypothetical protein